MAQAFKFLSKKIIYCHCLLKGYSLVHKSWLRFIKTQLNFIVWDMKSKVLISATLLCSHFRIVKSNKEVFFVTQTKERKFRNWFTIFDITMALFMAMATAGGR
jgi:hypothetical protein